MEMFYSVVGSDVIATLDVSGDRYTEVWSRTESDGQIHVAAPILMQLWERLFDGVSVPLQRAITDMVKILESSYDTTKSCLVPLVSFLTFFEGIYKKKDKYSVVDFDKLRGYVDVVSFLLSIDKQNVYESILSRSKENQSTETEELWKECETGDVVLANELLICLLRNKERLDALSTVVENGVRSYVLEDVEIYFERALTDLIGHIRGDLYGRIRRDAIQRCTRRELGFDMLGFIGNNRIVDVELGIAKVLYVVLGVNRLHTEVKDFKSGIKGKYRNVLLDLTGIKKDILTNLADKSYDFTITDIDGALKDTMYSIDEIAHLIVSGSVEDMW